MKFLTLAILVIAMISCKKSGVSPNEKSLMDTIHAQFFIKDKSWLYNTGGNLGGNAKLEYVNSKIVKRSGGYNTFINPLEYTDKKYDSVVYLYNKICLFYYDRTLPAIQKPRMWVIEMKDGKMKSRIAYLFSTVSGYEPQDTVYYFYDSNNRIKSIERHNSVPPDSYVYTWNYQFENDNLVKISGIYIKKPNTIRSTSEEIFSMYDNAANPLQNNYFFLWDDLYYRTVSKNNFGKYSFKRYDSANNLIESWLNIIPLYYDEFGNIRY